MGRKYVAKRVEDASYVNWDLVEQANVDIMPWAEFRCDIKVHAKLVYTSSELIVHMSCDEKNPLARYKNLNDPVCLDSCMEFFINPFSLNDKRYINFEVNPNGTIHIGIGENRHDRKLINISYYRSYFKIKTKICDSGWFVSFKIPFSFFEREYLIDDFIGNSKVIANFYKCGDETETPHYICWNNIVSEKPNFHLSDFFGEIELSDEFVKGNMELDVR